MTPFGINPYFLLVLLFVLGTCLGRIVNLCIEEIPREERVGPAWRRVGRRLRHLWSRYHLPIIGVYLTRSSHSTFPYRRTQREALVELLNGVIFVLLYLAEVPLSSQATLQQSGLFSLYAPDPLAVNSWMTPVMLLNLRYAFHLVLIESLMIATFIDFDLKIIPDGATMPAMFIGVVGSFVFGLLYLVPVWFQEPSVVRLLGIYFPEQYRSAFVVEKVPQWVYLYPHLHGLAVSLVGLIVGGGVVWAVRIIGQWTLRQEAMGFGDVILMAVIGSFLGWQATVTVFVISPLCALGGCRRFDLLQTVARNPVRAVSQSGRTAGAAGLAEDLAVHGTHLPPRSAAADPGDCHAAPSGSLPDDHATGQMDAGHPPVLR